MKVKAYLLFLYLCSSHIVFAQQALDTLPQLNLFKIALINQADSFITFPTDIGNISPLIFEANLNPSFVIRERKDSKLMAILTPQIIIRMFNEDSYPIRTPSYIPQISFYYLASKKQALNYLVLFGRIAHHSNGQEGNFYNDDTTINIKTGNFATNYMQFGFLKTSYSSKLKAIKTIKSAIEFHPKKWMLQEMRAIYSGFRWHNSFTSFKFPLNNNNNKTGKAKFSFKAETTLMLDNFNNLAFFDLERFNASLTFYYHPKFLEDIGLFVQFYHGADYYNINFKHQITAIRFGLMTEILRF
ncbi:hypothetical protein [Polaribacter sp. IC073]|uniref:hypothetical protein n=1 Tax=Polaribacter sp. IC073 TaxID=2508540 RepID=UPI0011BDA3B1|nr:hypothetical protein [Polaribacter sp. IC073]TXD49260.1 hypothetical protein ES045_04130 [Polaribacter sp. IC073]